MFVCIVVVVALLISFYFALPLLFTLLCAALTVNNLHINGQPTHTHIQIQLHICAAACFEIYF